jgi:hypothetical protein
LMLRHQAFFVFKAIIRRSAFTQGILYRLAKDFSIQKTDFILIFTNSP